MTPSNRRKSTQAKAADRTKQGDRVSRPPGTFGKYLSLWKIGLHIAMISTILEAWHLLSNDVADSTILSGPIATASELLQWITDGTLFINVRYTLVSLFVGFTIGAVFAQIVAVLLAEIPSFGRFFEPYILALSAIPTIALVPMFIIWTGLGIETKIVICALTTFFVVFVSAYVGLRSVDAHLLEMSRILKASWWQRLWKIKIVASLSYSIAGLKLALPRALIAVIVGEFLASNRGIGYLIVRNAQLLNAAGVFAGVFVLTALVFALMTCAAFIEAKLLRWKPKEKH